MDFQGALAFLLALGSLEIHQAIPSHQAILSWSLELGARRKKNWRSLEPGGASRSVGHPRGPLGLLGSRSSQEDPGGPGRIQDKPGGARTSQEEPGGPRRTQDKPGQARRTQEDPGQARRSQEEPLGPPRSPKFHLGSPRHAVG